MRARPRGGASAALAATLGGFLWIWVGRLLSVVGSGLTAFALGIWVYQQTGSATHFSLAALSQVLPALLLSPLAGALVDRWSRRAILIACDALVGLSSLVLALLWAQGELQVWHVYATNALRSALMAFQWPALTAASTAIVPREHLGRVAALLQLAESGSQTASPALGGLLLGALGTGALLLVDAASSALSVLSLCSLREPRRGAERAVQGGALGRRELLEGWRYIGLRPPLCALLAFVALNNFLSGIVMALATPLVLSFASVQSLGTALSVGALGALAGSTALAVVGGTRRRVLAILCGEAVVGCSILGAGLRPSLALFGACAFAFFGSLAIVNASSQALWQRVVPLALQGRVFAARRTVAWSCAPLAYLVAGPLAEEIFEPAMAPGGAAAAQLGPLLGLGAGRGIALLFVLIGAGTLALAAGFAGYAPLRRFEREVDAGVDPELETAPDAVQPRATETAG